MQLGINRMSSVFADLAEEPALWPVAVNKLSMLRVYAYTLFEEVQSPQVQ